jgi:peptidoglycan/LPS O-acetylase OafA/YrhL
MKEKSVYFPNLNAIRFIAALMVIVCHIELYKSFYGFKNYYHYRSYYFLSHFINIDFCAPLSNYWHFMPFLSMGTLGVVLFFTLSGFLITYLLLAEQQLSNYINIKNFYIRRVLRIWPLYYLFIFLGFFVMPNLPFFTLPPFPKSYIDNGFVIKLLQHLFLVPNYEYFVLGFIPYAGQNWSLGVEEQFYAFWPWAVKYFKSKYTFMLVFIVLYLGSSELAKYFALNQFLINLFEVINHSSMDCMAIGAVFALIGFEKDSVSVKIKEFVFGRKIQMLVFCSTVLLVFIGVKNVHYFTEFFSVMFGIIILNLALNPNRIVNIEYGWLDYLGKISYGLYMYHIFGIIITLKLLPANLATNNFLVYPSSIGLSILFSAISYKYMEKWFISRKRNFSAIISGDLVKDSK